MEESEPIPNEEAVSASAEVVETHEVETKEDEAMLDVHPAHHAASYQSRSFGAGDVQGPNEDVRRGDGFSKGVGVRHQRCDMGMEDFFQITHALRLPL